MKLERERGNVGGRAFGAAILLSFGRALTKASSFISLAVLARLLDPGDYGIVALAFTIIALLQAVFETGSNTVLVVKDDLSRDDLDTAFTLGLVRGCALGLALFLLANPLGALFGDKSLAPVLQALAISPIIYGFANPALAVYSRNLDFRREVVRDVMSALISAAAGIGLALWLRNYWALVGAAIAGAGIQMLLSHWRMNYRPRLGLRNWRLFASMGSWIAGERLLSQLNTVAPQLVIWHFLTPRALGIFTVASNLQSMPLTEMLEPIRRSLLPGLATFAQDHDALRRAFRKSQAVICGIALPIGVGMAALADWIVLVMLGGKWLDAVILLQILGPIVALKTAVGPVNNLAVILNALRSALWRTTIILLVTYPLLALTTWWLGLPGAALGVALLAVLRIILNVRLLRQLLGEPLLGLFYNGWRSMLAAGVMALCLWLLPVAFSADRPFLWTAALLALQIGFGAAVYIAAHTAIWLAKGKPMDGVEAVAGAFAAATLNRALGLRRQWMTRRMAGA